MIASDRLETFYLPTIKNIIFPPNPEDDPESYFIDFN